MKQDRLIDAATLGELSDEERTAFYDDLMEDDPATFNMFGLGGNAKYFENPTLRVGLVEVDNRVVPAQESKAVTIRNASIDIWIERYFVQSMPMNKFNLQLVLSVRHFFKDKKDSQEIAYTLAAKGLLKDYVNYITEPVFKGLSVKDSLSR